MDIGSMFRTDAYRVLLVHLIPGAVAIAPWVFAVGAPGLLDAKAWSGGAGIAIGVALLLGALAAGLVLEDLGGRFELNVVDAWQEMGGDGCSVNVWQVWNQFLALPAGDEIVARGYLRSILLRFKFELGMVGATLVAGLGYLVAAAIGRPGAGALGWIGVAHFGLGVYLAWEAKSAGRLLHQLRCGIVGRAVGLLECRGAPCRDACRALRDQVACMARKPAGYGEFKPSRD